MDCGNMTLGIEIGSTRTKAVLIDENHIPVASGEYESELTYENGLWTYPLSAVHTAVRMSYINLKDDFTAKFGQPPANIGAVGVSAMMHGYLAFDKDDNLLTPFRTWRNTMTGQAAEELTALFGFNIPQRWSVAHLYQAILNGEEHVPRIAYMTTLAGYVHNILTGVNALGVGDASGMFPIDESTGDYDAGMLAKFDELVKPRNLGWTLRDLLPPALPAGADAGALTQEGAYFLDPTGALKPGSLAAPPEGDAGTGMAATNSVRARTGNVSAGTSDFAMIVVERKPGVHREIDMVTTPDGLPVAMVHCNNCTSDINAWVGLLSDFADEMGFPMERGALFTELFNLALQGDADCGGLLSYNYYSGEGVTDFDAGRPVFLRLPDSRLTLANFMRTHLYSALATLKIGLDILFGEEKVTVDKLYGHGGYFKTPLVGQRMLSAATASPVSVMQTAGEGGPYGMALLAAYRLRKGAGESLADYLDNKVFAGAQTVTVMADEGEIAGFAAFLARYVACLGVEKAAVDTLKD